MERLNFETLFRVVRWDYNRCFKDESLDKNCIIKLSPKHFNIGAKIVVF